MNEKNAVGKNLASLERFARISGRTVAAVAPIIRARFPEMIVTGEIDLDDTRVKIFLAEPRPAEAQRYYVEIDLFCQALGLPRSGARERFMRRFGQAIDGDSINFLDPLVAAYVREIPPLSAPRAQYQTVEPRRADGVQHQRVNLRPDPQAKRVETYSNDPGPNDRGYVDLKTLARLIRGEISEMPSTAHRQVVDRDPHGPERFTAS